MSPPSYYGTGKPVKALRTAFVRHSEVAISGKRFGSASVGQSLGNSFCDEGLVR
jgi:hypothetical protein